MRVFLAIALTIVFGLTSLILVSKPAEAKSGLLGLGLFEKHKAKKAARKAQKLTKKATKLKTKVDAGKMKQKRAVRKANRLLKKAKKHNLVAQDATLSSVGPSVPPPEELEVPVSNEPKQEARREVVPRERVARNSRSAAHSVRTSTHVAKPSRKPQALAAAKPSPKAKVVLAKAATELTKSKKSLVQPARLSPPMTDPRPKTSSKSPTSLRLVLDDVERHFGKVSIISHCRPGAKIAGSGRPSKHASCNAIDFNPPPGKYNAVAAWLKANHNGGVGTYSGHFHHIHIDVGGHARWHN